MTRNDWAFGVFVVVVGVVIAASIVIIAAWVPELTLMVEG